MAADEPTRATLQWQAQPWDSLRTLAQAWAVVDFFVEVPPHLHGSLLLALMRNKALVVSFSDGRSLLLIRFADAAAVWQYDGRERCEQVQRIRQDQAWLLACMPQGQGTCVQPLPAAPLVLRPAARGHVNLLVGTQQCITCLPASRSWDWAWSPTLGPLYLTVYVERSAAQIREWLGFNLPYGYAFDGRGLRSTRHPREQLRNSDQICYRDGAIHFLHGYYRNVAPTDNACAVFLLRKLARGELGELSFDLFDGDYGHLCAAGYGCDSLNRYLNRRPHYDRRKPHPWNALKRLHISVPADSDANEHIRRALNDDVGLPQQAPFGAALALPIAQLPRWITVRLPPGVRQFDRHCHDPQQRVAGRINWWTEGPEDSV